MKDPICFPAWPVDWSLGSTSCGDHHEINPRTSQGCGAGLHSNCLIDRHVTPSTQSNLFPILICFFLILIRIPFRKPIQAESKLARTIVRTSFDFQTPTMKTPSFSMAATPGRASSLSAFDDDNNTPAQASILPFCHASPNVKLACVLARCSLS